ncbi:PAS domain-containing protein [Roseofilum casamattae]|uniref:histidine kinase n=1 Tax=Roseofilum casamattae BLCC-M143 TaxID=3022442 RepID=A0ABT7BUD5_9CYAN|nr:PAS domain S-box protein [Roseofilum casamattae]MDJ1182801.1 PAS domain-containing protein [Roseofilum casamattae BLCC-M143]
MMTSTNGTLMDFHQRYLLALQDSLVNPDTVRPDGGEESQTSNIIISEIVRDARLGMLARTWGISIAELLDIHYQTCEELVCSDRAAENHQFLRSVLSDYEQFSREYSQPTPAENFRHLVENIDEVFWLIQVDKGRMIYVSPSYEVVWGRSCQSLYDNPQSWLNAIHPKECDRIQATLPAQNHGNWEQEYRILHSSGLVRWIRTQCFPVRHSCGEIYRIAAISEDITQRKQADMALDRSLSLLQATLESTADGILVLDQEGAILNFNQQYQQLWHIPSSVLSLRDSRLAIAFILDLIRYPEEFLNIIAQEYQYPDRLHHYAIELKDTRVLKLVSRPYKLNGAIRGRVQCFSDITAEHHNAKLLESLNESLQVTVTEQNAQLQQILHQLQPSIQESANYS